VHYIVGLVIRVLRVAFDCLYVALLVKDDKIALELQGSNFYGFFF
jgi:hypothetical protein